MSSKRIIRTCQRGIHAALFFALLALASHSSAQRDPLVQGLDAIGITVSDMDRAVDFYSKVLTFEKVSDTEVAGENYEHLEGVFGLRMRVVRMWLCDESIELTEYLAPICASPRGAQIVDRGLSCWSTSRPATDGLSPRMNMPTILFTGTPSFQ